MRTISVTPLIRIGAMFGATLLIVAACSSSTGASTAPSVAPSAAASVAASAAAGGETYTVAVVTDPKLGALITGEDGKTLYTFATDACAAKWPPFTVESDDTLTPGAGVTGALTTFARADGKMQVAINGRPLYYYAADTKAGDTTGEGVGGKWFVATPTGVTAAPAASPAASTAPSSQGAY